MYDVLSLAPVKFPEGFIWGSSSSAYQTEGDNFNCDFYQAELDGHMKEPCGKACNAYAMYKEDIAMIQRLGHKAYRFGVEWSRVETARGEFNAEAVAHYVDMARRLRDAGIQPWVTLHHFSNPLWFTKLGEWHQRANVDAFLEFVEHLVPRLAPYIAGWVPINEYNLHGGMPPQPENHKKMAAYKFNFLLADAGTYDIIKAHSAAPAASCMAYVPFQGSQPHDRTDAMMADYTDWCSYGFYYHAIRTGEWVYPFVDGGYFPQLKGRADFWAANMYVRQLVNSRSGACKGERYPHTFLPLIDNPDFYANEFSPDHLMWNLQRLKDKPVILTENGCCADDDRFRIAYLAMHLAAFRHAIDTGVDLKGYFYWCLMDNYEWGSYLPRFGMVDCDRQTFVRTPKPSSSFYRDIIAANGFSGQTVRKYLDRLPSRADGK